MDSPQQPHEVPLRGLEDARRGMEPCTSRAFVEEVRESPARDQATSRGKQIPRSFLARDDNFVQGAGEVPRPTPLAPIIAAGQSAQADFV